MKASAVALAALLPLLAALPPGVDRAKLIGSPNAPILMEIFSSFDCPHCKVLHEEILPRLVRDYVTPGKLAILSREYPLWGQYHPYARQAADYATAAARIGKYEQVADTLFKNQFAWTSNGQVWETVASVLTAPEQKRVEALAKDPGVVAEVQKDVDLATKDGVNQTPSIFLTAKGKRFPMTPGVPSYELLKALLDDQLK
jgi:protein-disulfide isomerase